MAWAVQETSSSEIFGGQSDDFLRRDCNLEPPIFRFAEMMLHEMCSTSYDLAFLCRGRRRGMGSELFLGSAFILMFLRSFLVTLPCVCNNLDLEPVVLHGVC